ncbi:hypothetical protein [Acinetobacter baumannii]|uniref:hypothetical protein n=1 Tax=Acinetobacter baumannii TaxID=470 RepID=UPI00285F1823|nr:hypothetical protein [Acinetobacter baumannii]MDR8173248.1 hypothetical protein [Acinetobacter baumannii]
MKISDLMTYHGCKNRKELSEKTGYSTVTLWKWENNGIPARTQDIWIELRPQTTKSRNLGSLTA